MPVMTDTRLLAYGSAPEVRSSARCDGIVPVRGNTPATTATQQPRHRGRAFGCMTALTMSAATRVAFSLATTGSPSGWGTTTTGKPSRCIDCLIAVARCTKFVVATTTAGLPVSSKPMASSILPDVHDPHSATPATRKSASAAICWMKALSAGFVDVNFVVKITLLTP